MKETGCSELLLRLFNEECRQIENDCIEEGYPARGANYDLRTGQLWQMYYEEEYEEARGYC